MVRKKILCGILILCLLLATFAVPAPKASASSSSTGSSSSSSSSSSSGSKVTEEGIREKEGQIDQAKKDIDGLKKGLSDIQQMKKELETEKNNLKGYVVKLDQNLAVLEQNILDLQDQIARKQIEIAQTTIELEQAEKTAQNQYDYMVMCIRYIYEASTLSTMWEVLFGTENISDFFNRIDYMNRVQEYNQGLWDEYQMSRRYIALCREELEVDKELLDEQMKNVANEQAKVEALITEKQKQIVAYESDISNQEKAIKEKEEEIAEQNAILAELEKLVKEEKERLKQQNQAGQTYDGGVFKFPLASYTRVSDEFGYRKDPILGVQQFHSGVDFAAPKGTAIYAAYDGVVVAATYHYSMGNYVMIDHGDGLYTIYMHASALYVSANDKVKRGDTIAAVGSTGRSTGNHLHFSVRKDGVYVSPWDYISR